MASPSGRGWDLAQVKAPCHTAPLWWRFFNTSQGRVGPPQARQELRAWESPRRLFLRKGLRALYLSILHLSFVPSNGPCATPCIRGTSLLTTCTVWWGQGRFVQWETQITTLFLKYWKKRIVQKSTESTKTPGRYLPQITKVNRSHLFQNFKRNKTLLRM